MPATLAVAFAAHRAKAASETPVGRAQRRGVWATAAFAIAVSAAASAWHRSFGWPPALLALGGAAIGAFMLARDVGELVSLRRVAERVRGMSRRNGPLPRLVDMGAQKIDLGAGDAIFDEVEPGEPFRGVDRLLRTVHGDPAEASHRVIFSVARDLALVGISAAAVYATVISAGAYSPPLF